MQLYTCVNWINTWPESKKCIEFCSISRHPSPDSPWKMHMCRSWLVNLVLLFLSGEEVVRILNYNQHMHCIYIEVTEANANNYWHFVWNSILQHMYAFLENHSVKPYITVSCWRQRGHHENRTTVEQRGLLTFWYYQISEQLSEPWHIVTSTKKAFMVCVNLDLPKKFLWLCESCFLMH